MDDQDDIIDNILNEEENIDIEYNKTNYDINDILNEDNDPLELKEDLKKTSTAPPKEEPQKEALQSSGETPKEIAKEPLKETIKENSVETPKEQPKELKIETKPTDDVIKKENDINKKEKDEQLKRDIEKILEEDIKKKNKEKEEIMKKKKANESNKILKYTQYKNPLDFIGNFEYQNSNIQNQIEKEFILQNHRKQDNKYEVLETKSLFEKNNEIKEFNIKAIYSKFNYLIIITKEGTILLYSITQKNIIKAITPKKKNKSNINCLDVIETEMIIGYEDGTIIVLNIDNGNNVCTNNEIYKDCSCIELKIYQKDEKKGEIYFISSGGDGKIFFHTLKNNIFSWKIYSVPINAENKTPIFMIKFVSFSTKIKYSNLKHLKKYVILGSLDQISLFCVAPLQKIFIIKKPDFIKERVVPDAQIGIGRSPEVIIRFTKKDENNHLLLAISWGKIVFFYQLPIVNEINIIDYKEIGYYVNLFDILRIGFISTSVLYCLDKSFGIKVIDTLKINKGKINSLPDPNNKEQNALNALAEIEKSRLISAYISSQKILYDNNCPKDTYLYTIVDYIDANISVLVLGEKNEIFIAKLKNWKNFLNELEKKKDFINLFSVGIDLYTGKMTALSDIPKRKKKNNTSKAQKDAKNISNEDELVEYLKPFARQYIILNNKEKKSGYLLEDVENKEKMTQCIKMTIEYCIEIGAFDYLIDTIEPLLQSKEYGELFLTQLEPFILLDKIININLSREILLELIESYNKNGKLDVLSQMLLHVNINSIDTIEIKYKLEELNLSTILIYLYMYGKNEDYFAPIKQMYNYYTTRAISAYKYIYNEKESCIDFSYALTKKLITPKELINCKEYIGYKIIWYIKWCLSGKKFPEKEGNKMNQELYNSFIPQLTYWLLSPNVLDEFLNLDPKNYFMIHKNIFTINSLRELLVKEAENTKHSIEAKSVLSSSDIKIDDIYPASLVNYMILLCKKKNQMKINFYLYEFIVNILNVDINIEKELKLEAICFILKNYSKFVKQINNQEVKNLTSNLTKQFKNEECFTEENYKTILYSINDDLFNELKLFLYDKMDYFEDCLKLYLDKKLIIGQRNTKLYKWLDDKIKIYKIGTDKYEKLLEIIKEHSFQLASLSLDNFIKLSGKIFQEIDKEVILKLKPDKKIQLEYILKCSFKYIKSLDNNENNIPNEETREKIEFVLLLHIQLLCDLKMYDSIVKAFKECVFYPLNKCLKICEDAKAYESCLYIYLKEGAIEKAFKMGCSYLDDTFNKLITIISDKNDKKEYDTSLDIYKKYLNDIINICDNEQHLEDLWFDILGRLYNYDIKCKDLEKNIDSDTNKDKNILNKKEMIEDFHQTILKDIKELLEKMCVFVSINRILDVVSEQNKNAGYKEFKELLMKIVNSYSNLSSLLLSARKLLNNLVLTNEYSFQNLNLRGECLKSIECGKCKKLIEKSMSNKESIIVFNCKHVFHKKCIIKNEYNNIKEIFCPICSELEFQNNDYKGNSLIQNKNYVIEDKRNEKSNKFIDNLDATKKKALIKLERYDERNLEKQISMLHNSIKVLVSQYQKEYK